MTWSKYNNPNRKRKLNRKMDRTDADILATKQMLDDAKNGKEMSIKYYDELSDRLCGKPSRNIYKED
jgi:hypothetical protein